MRALLITILFLFGCAVQAPFKGSDSEARELLLSTWSRPGEHWTYREGGKGEFNTYIGHPHFPFTYEFKWSIKDSVLYLKYEQNFEKQQKEYTYRILELRKGRLVLTPISGGEKLVLTVYNF